MIRKETDASTLKSREVGKEQFKIYNGLLYNAQQGSFRIFVKMTAS